MENRKGQSKSGIIVDYLKIYYFEDSGIWYFGIFGKEEPVVVSGFHVSLHGVEYPLTEQTFYILDSQLFLRHTQIHVWRVSDQDISLLLTEKAFRLLSVNGSIDI